MDHIVWAVLVGTLLAGFVQGLSGFGFGLVAMSVWAWTLEPRLAASLAVFGALVGQVMATFTLRRKVNWPLLWPFLIGGLLGIPLGVMVLPLVNVALFKAILGGLLVIWCPSMLLATRLPPVSIKHPLANAVVGAVGGVMGGLGGFSGAVPTLWCTLKQMDKDAQRSVIQNFNLSILAVTLLTYVGTGIVTTDMLPLFALIVPTLLVPVFLGTRVYIGISDQTFKKIVLSLLTLAGVTLLLSALPQLL
ncbi:MAG: sulfite exporter TauE/SafE family protein [Neisseriaceae bacterium]|nr:sulfite exporter TauE/SafE family protein [Neisseriaceae bacterium]MBP6861862.1 sulfite exporter TauE/SafE family protein [Neisseriaceae bacterium]